MKAVTKPDQVVGRRIGEHRRRRGMSIGDMSLKSAVSEVDLEEIENGEKRVEPDQMVRISTVLDVRTAVFAGCRGVGSVS